MHVSALIDLLRSERLFDTAAMGSRKREYVPPPLTTGRDGLRRHCWIVHDLPAGTGPWPALVIEWARRQDGWWARLVYVPYPSEPGTLAEAWIKADRLQVVEITDRDYTTKTLQLRPAH